MKHFVLFLALGLNAYASDQLGDYAVFQGTYEGMPLTVSGEYTSFQNNAYEQKNSYDLDGNQVTEFETIALADAVTPAKIQAVLDSCESEGGSRIFLSTPAGQIETCKMSQILVQKLIPGLAKGYTTSDTLWVAQVPVFGVAKITQGSSVLTVQSYRWGPAITL